MASPIQLRPPGRACLRWLWRIGTRRMVTRAHAQVVDGGGMAGMEALWSCRRILSSPLGIPCKPALSVRAAQGAISLWRVEESSFLGYEVELVSACGASLSCHPSRRTRSPTTAGYIPGYPEPKRSTCEISSSRKQGESISFVWSSCYISDATSRASGGLPFKVLP